MQPPAVFVTIVLIGAFALIFLVLYQRHRNQQMFHQERLAALEKGAAVPAAPVPAPWSPRVYLLRGLIWSFGGAALFIFLLGVAASHRPESAQEMAWHAKQVSDTLNIPLDQARQIVEKDQAERGDMPAALALLGLIPLGVGLAYLVFYYSDPARKELAPPSERS